MNKNTNTTYLILYLSTFQGLRIYLDLQDGIITVHKVNVSFYISPI